MEDLLLPSSFRLHPSCRTLVWNRKIQFLITFQQTKTILEIRLICSIKLIFTHRPLVFPLFIVIPLLICTEAEVDVLGLIYRLGRCLRFKARMIGFSIFSASCLPGLLNIRISEIIFLV